MSEDETPIKKPRGGDNRHSKQSSRSKQMGEAPREGRLSRALGIRCMGPGAGSGLTPGNASEIAVVGIDDRQSETAATDRHRHRRLLGRLSVPKRNNRDPDVAQDSADDETKKRRAARDEQPLQEGLAPEVGAIAKARVMKNFQDLKVKVEATRLDIGVKVEHRGKERTEPPSAAKRLLAAMLVAWHFIAYGRGGAWNDEGIIPWKRKDAADPGPRRRKKAEEEEQSNNKKLRSSPCAVVAGPDAG